MITKTFFLAKIIHRIRTRNLRQEKTLRENPVDNGIFFVLRAIRGRVLHKPPRVVIASRIFLFSSISAY